MPKNIPSLPKIRKKFLKVLPLNPGLGSLPHILDENRQPRLVEIRRRNQVYLALDYLSSQTSYFSFFTKESIYLLRRAKHLCFLLKTYKEKPVSKAFPPTKKSFALSPDLLLYAFVFSKSELQKILKNFGITSKKIQFYIQRKYPLQRLSFPQRLGNFFFSFWITFQLRRKFPKRKISFSSDLTLVFEKACQNALERFKTPVITPELLFITLMEEPTFKPSIILHKLIPKGTDFYLLKYKLLKRLHREETAIRQEVSSNQRYFAYLLKIHIRMRELGNLLDWCTFKYTTAFFRYLLVNTLTHFNLKKVLRKEIQQTLHIQRHKRHYAF
jgi:hypothetical protein